MTTAEFRALLVESGEFDTEDDAAQLDIILARWQDAS